MTKRKCKNCGQVHLHCPFTDCFSGDINEIESLEDYYNERFN